MENDVEKLHGAIEDMYYVGGDALLAIKTLAKLAMHECERGDGKVSADLVLNALGEIAYRASDAENTVCHAGESVGVNDAGHWMKPISGAKAALGRALNPKQPAGA